MLFHKAVTIHTIYQSLPTPVHLARMLINRSKLKMEIKKNHRKLNQIKGN